MRFFILFLVFAATALPAQVTTSQYDNARSNANLHEHILTPQNVNAKGLAGSVHSRSMARSSDENSPRDHAAMATRFVIPVVINGMVYFGTRSEIEVYGLLK